MKIFISSLLVLLMAMSSFRDTYGLRIQREQSIDSLGACQGVSIQKGKIYLYGDREVGIIREYQLKADSLVYQKVK